MTAPTPITSKSSTLSEIGVPITKWVIRYARLGFPVFPCQYILANGQCSCGQSDCLSSAGKHPLFKNWQRQATTDPVIVAAMWRTHPLANIATATGILFDVFDVDHPDVSEWERLTGFHIPPTWWWRTGSGGAMFAFQPDRRIKNRVKAIPFADTRALTGLAILPPSRNRKGQYRWEVSPRDVALAPWPAELLAALATPERPKTKSAPIPVGYVPRLPPGLLEWARRGAPQGRQHNSAWWLACRLRQYGVDDADGMRVLEEFGWACVPPASIRKLAAIWEDSADHQTFAGRGRQLPHARYRAGVTL
jgi:Bifunctional DNA primase/polymerase, N-terminal